jgi:hypothetical protein
MCKRNPEGWPECTLSRRRRDATRTHTARQEVLDLDSGPGLLSAGQRSFAGMTGVRTLPHPSFRPSAARAGIQRALADPTFL